MIKKLVLIFLCFFSIAHAVERITADPKEVMTFISKYLPVKPIILEAGGFNGTDTEIMANLWPKSTIYTFEPIPILFEELSKRTAKYLNIHPYNLALGDRNGQMSMWVSTYPWGGNSGSSSLMAPKDHLDFDLSKFDQQIDVTVAKLDTWAKSQKVGRFDFLWLDMQGLELNMLKCSKKALTAKVIYIEVGFVEMYAEQPLYADVKKWMLEKGYKLVAIDFDEKIALKGKEAIWPGNGIFYYGNCVFVKK